MTSTTATTDTAAPPPHEAESLPLRLSGELAHVPPERPPAPPGPVPVSAPAVVAASSTAPATAATPVAANAPAEPLHALALNPATTPPITWLFMSAALLGGAGWIIERRKRRLMEMEKDSVMWADVQPAPGASAMDTHQGLDDILRDGQSPAEKARAIFVTAIGETTSRREATLIDLHQLDGKITRRRVRGDLFDAVLLLQEHLVDFRYTSPWAFLELRELYKVLGRNEEWDIARGAFRQRFGQNAPTWSAPSTEKTCLLDDAQLSSEVARQWPNRESRMFLLRWMLGDPAMRQKGMGPPLLTLGVYRDMLFLDTLLDEVMVAKPKRVDSLL